MRFTKLARYSATIAAAAAMGCSANLDVVNPNAPDARRALSDPAALEAVGSGALRTWINTWSAGEGNMVLDVQAQSYTASWNNFNMNFYAQIDGDGTRNTRVWQNDPAAAGRTSVEAPWTGYYSAMSSATDVLTALRVNNVELSTPDQTKRLEIIAELVQAASEMQVALMYDKGYVVDETVDFATLTYSDRKVMRDAARARLDEVIALAGANTFTTPTAWLNGYSLTNTQVAQLANTMNAMLLAYWPRNAAENGQVDWAAVANYASKGISSGTSFDFQFIGDGGAWYPETYCWFNSMDTGRVSTRVAAMLDPVTQKHPWARPGNPQPNSPDKRLGDGSFGTADMIPGFGNVPKTANAGTDFAWSSQAIFNAARGDYQQSNIAHIRYDASGTQDPSSIYGCAGTVPVISAAVNDLLWAEGLIRTNGNLATAATLINKTRVTRGGLPAATAGDGAAGLTTKMQYEQEVELLGMGGIPFYNRRRVDGLITGTPHEMPVPAKELGVFGQALYTWGGATPNSPTPP
jgi:hypothetical protein